MTQVVIVPGNGAGDVECTSWYAWVRDQVRALGIEGVTVHLENMPDPVIAPESLWLPFMKDTLQCDQDTIIIGHSSGAAAAMRYCECERVRGIVLVSAYTSDLGDECEIKSGYFNRPWKWDDIRNNTGFIVQFGSSDDPFLPWTEQCEVARELKADFREYNDRGEFMSPTFPELVKEIEARLKQQ